MRIGKRGMLFVALAALCTLTGAVRLWAAADGAQRVAEGQDLLAQKRFGEAERAFKSALREAPIDARKGLGKVAFVRKDWGKAKDAYEKVLKLAPGDIEALYRLAICFRETGKFKALMFRRADWNRSRRLFEQVLEQDSLYLDAVYQYAILKRCRGKYREAILLGHRQVAQKPDLRAAQLGLFRLYLHFLDNRGEWKTIAWLRRQDFEHARCFVGEALRRAGRPAQADSVLRAWLAAAPSISTVPARLSLVRLAYQRGQPGAAEATFRTAVDSIRTRLDAELIFEDVKYVVTEMELESFRGLSSPEEYRGFYRRFWTGRDPTPAADTNARLAEHYRRLIYAEAYYVYDGFRTWANSPDKTNELAYPATFYLNDRFNDKGLIYIRHGDPNDYAQTPGQNIVVNTSWFYGKTETLPEMVFHFVVDENASGNNWRLSPYPGSVQGRETWGAVYQPPQGRRRRGRGRGGRWRGGQQPGDLRRMAREREMAVQSRSAVAVGFRTDRHAWERDIDPLPYDSYLAFFKEETGGTMLELYYGVPLKDTPVADTSAVYEYGMALHDLEWHPVMRHRGRIVAEEIPRIRFDETGIGTVRLQARPDSCHAAFYIGERTGRRLGGWKGDIRIPAFSEVALEMSSIVPAHTISSAVEANDAFFFRGLHLVPNPSRRFLRKKPVYIYFEVYNLTPDEGGVTSFEVEYTVSRRKRKRPIKKRLSIFGSNAKPATAVAVERTGDTPTSAEYLSLDLSRIGRGEFRLDIKVTDRRSGEQSEDSVDLVLF